MQSISIKRLTEADFDSIVSSAGGTRIIQSGRADYQFSDAIIELKLIEEEGLEKRTRQEKIAKLFRRYLPSSPVIPILPKKLPLADQRAYYNAMAGPIQTAVKKGASQLDLTTQDIRPRPTRVLTLINVGYTAVSLEEFKEIALKCVHNDTEKVDWLIVGGIYVYSDAFDSYVIAPFEGVPVCITTSFRSFEALDQSWGIFVERVMTDFMRHGPAESGKMAVEDISFVVDGVTYVKAAPRLTESEFWSAGERPRENLACIEKFPQIVKTYPDFNEADWKELRNLMPGERRLKNTYSDWREHLRSKESNQEVLTPFVAVRLSLEEVRQHQQTRDVWDFAELCEMSNTVFNAKVERLIESACERGLLHVTPLEYLLLEVEEIGHDQANDLSSLYHVSCVPGFERKDAIFENLQLFCDYGIVVACIYAVKRNVDYVFFSKHRIC